MDIVHSFGCFIFYYYYYYYYYYFIIYYLFISVNKLNKNRLEA